MRVNGLKNTSWIFPAGLLLILSLHFWFPSWDRKPLHDTYSTERPGKKAFYLLSGRRFSQVKRNNSSPVGVIENLERNDIFCLLGPSRYPDKREWKVLLDWVRGGGSLIIAPRHDQPMLAIEELDLRVETRYDFELDLHELLEEVKKQEEAEKAQVETILFGGGELKWKSSGKIVGENAEVLVKHGDEPQAVVKKHGAGRVLLVASDFIFSNESLAWKDNGILALRLLESVADPESDVVFDEYLNTIGAPKIVGLLFDPFMRPVTLQAVALLWVFAWCGSRRFGRAIPRIDSTRHDIADHTDALGNMYYRARDGQTALRYYFEQLRMELRLKYVSTSDGQALDALARRSGLNAQYLRDLLQRAETAAKAPLVRRKTAAGIIRELAALRHAARRVTDGG